MYLTNKKNFFKTKTKTKLLYIIVAKTITKTKKSSESTITKTKTKTKLHFLLKLILILKLFSLPKQHWCECVSVSWQCTLNSSNSAMTVFTSTKHDRELAKAK